MNKVMVALGKQIRQHRKAAGLTQGELAEKCGIYRPYLSRIENGTANPLLTVILAIADALKVPIDKLMGNHDRVS